MWRQDFSRNIGIGSSSLDLLADDKISLETSGSESHLNHVQGWCTTGKSILQLEAETGKEAWIWVILSLQCLEKELQSEWVVSWAGRETEVLLWNVIFIVSELTRIVRVVGDYASMKVRFSFIHEPIAEMERFSISTPVVCVISSIFFPSISDALWHW